MTEQQYEAIEEIMDNFNFEKVHIAMKAVNWTWGLSEGAVPEIHHLRKQARKLLRQAIMEKTNVLTGGFHVQYLQEDGEYLHLSFVFEDWDIEF